MPIFLAHIVSGGICEFVFSHCQPSRPKGSEGGFRDFASDEAGSDGTKGNSRTRKTHCESDRAQQQHHGIDQTPAVDLHLKKTNTCALNIGAAQGPVLRA